MVGEGRVLQLNTDMSGHDQVEQRQIDAARRDPNAFAPLYAAYFDPIYRYCYLRLHHRELAADAASQTFLKALAGNRRISLRFVQELALCHRPQCHHRHAARSRPHVDLEHAELIHDRAPTPRSKPCARTIATGSGAPCNSSPMTNARCWSCGWPD